MGKPTRAVRRFTRKRAHAKGQSKGKGRGKGSSAFLASMSDTEVDVFAGLGRKGKSKGKGKRTSGKGFGRKRNPIGRDGAVMTCNTCGSELHFANNCDGSGPRGQGAHHSQLWVSHSLLAMDLSETFRSPVTRLLFS